MKRITLLVALAAVTWIAPNAVAQPIPPSGMLLGVYVVPNWHCPYGVHRRGLRVLSTIPGYSAHGKLFPGDVLLRVTADGVQIFPIRTLWEIEYAKDVIGPFRPAALEVYRPGVGLVYFWVEFQPVAITARSGHEASGTRAPMRARIMTERERPGARALFGRGAAIRPGASSGIGLPPRIGRPQRPGSAAGLFSR